MILTRLYPHCGECGKRTRRPVNRCPDCRRAGMWVIKVCAFCGQNVRKRSRYVRRQEKDPRYKGQYFCNEHCNGKWLGTKYGSAALRRYRNRKNERRNDA